MIDYYCLHWLKFDFRFPEIARNFAVEYRTNWSVIVHHLRRSLDVKMEVSQNSQLLVGKLDGLEEIDPLNRFKTRWRRQRSPIGEVVCRTWQERVRIDGFAVEADFLSLAGTTLTDETQQLLQSLMFCTMLNEGSQNAESIRLVNRLSKTAIEHVVVNEVDLRGEASLLQRMLGSTHIVYTPVEMELGQLELPDQGSSGQA